MKKENIKKGMFLLTKNSDVFNVIDNTTLRSCFRNFTINLNNFNDYMICDYDCYTIISETNQPIVFDESLNGRVILSKLTGRKYFLYFGDGAKKMSDGFDVLPSDWGAGNRAFPEKGTYNSYYIFLDGVKKYIGYPSVESGDILDSLIIDCQRGYKFLINSNYLNKEFELEY